MKPWQVATLGAFTLALTVAASPLLLGAWVVRLCRHKGRVG